MRKLVSKTSFLNTKLVSNFPKLLCVAQSAIHSLLFKLVYKTSFIELKKLVYINKKTSFLIKKTSFLIIKVVSSL